MAGSTYMHPSLRGASLSGVYWPIQGSTCVMGNCSPSWAEFFSHSISGHFASKAPQLEA